MSILICYEQYGHSVFVNYLSFYHLSIAFLVFFIIIFWQFHLILLLYMYALLLQYVLWVVYTVYWSFSCFLCYIPLYLTHYRFNISLPPFLYVMKLEYPPFMYNLWWCFSCFTCIYFTTYLPLYVLWIIQYVMYYSSFVLCVVFFLYSSSRLLPYVEKLWL